MNKISAMISRGERADFSNTWKVTGDFFSDEAASGRANSSVSVPPRAQYRCVIRMTGAQAWHTEDIGASSQLSDFSNTLENKLVMLGEGAFGKDNINEKVFEWRQFEATAIPEEIICNYLIVTPRRTLRSYSDLLPAGAWVSNLLTRIQHRTPVKAKVEEKTEIASEFEGKVTAECIKFCNTYSLISDLRKCLNEAKVAFSKRQSLMAEYDCFDEDEYEEDGHVVIRVKVNSDEKTALEEYNYFTDWMLDNISDDNLDFFFVTVSRT